MGITPIIDASGLTDQLGANTLPVKPAEKEGADFRSVWNDQAASKNSKAAEIGSNDSFNRDADKTKTNVSDKTGKADETRKSADRPEEASKTDVKGKESPEKAEVKDVNDNSDDGKMLKDEEIVTATECLSALISDLAEKIAELLDMTPEEFENLLQANGITEAGLLDKDILSSLLVNALGADSQLDLLTNEADYEVFKNGMDLLNVTLASDSGIEDLDVSGLKDLLEENGIDVNALPVKEVPVTEETDITNVRTERFVRNSEGDFELAEVTESGAVTGEAKVVMQAAQAENRGKDSGADQRGDEHQANIGAFDVSDAAPAEAESPVSEIPLSYTQTTNEIAEQILDHMKTVTDGDYTDVEMQLHPASLGNLQIHVTNNAGVITASFVTENEAVRSAVESQMIRLVEQFEEQGIKVDAVEVTVASHSFEGNLEQNAGEPGEEAGRGGRRVRKIDLSDDEELDTSAMEDEERIAAEMMAANGNKVDYMA